MKKEIQALKEALNGADIAFSDQAAVKALTEQQQTALLGALRAVLAPMKETVAKLEIQVPLEVYKPTVH